MTVSPPPEGPVPGGPFVVASHPSKQAFFYRIPVAAQRCGLPGVFLTGLYYKPDRLVWRLAAALPRVGQLLPNRRDPDLDDARVISLAGPVPEILGRYGRYRAADALHDRLAARWLRRLAAHPDPVVVHGALGSARDTFRMAKRLGMRTVLEVTLPPGAQRIVAREAAALGFAAPVESDQAREREELALADVAIVLNRFSVPLLEELGVPRERIVLLPWAVDTARFRPREGARRPGPLRVLFVGHQSARKGLHVLLAAWESLGRTDAELLVAGPVVDATGPAIRERYAGRFVDLGRIPHAQIPAVYADADVFVMPSLFEGGPLVVIEAMASGLPCLVTDAAASVVEHEADGLIVPAGDASALAAGLARLLDDAALRRRLGTRAQHAIAGFDHDGHAARLCRLYRALGAGAPPLELVSLSPLPTASPQPPDG